MAKQEWTIRVQQPGKPEQARAIGSVNLPGLWIEQLRRLGVLRVLKEWDGTDLGGEFFELAYPGDKRGIDTYVWATQNAQRMQSFGINAVAAPKWGG